MLFKISEFDSEMLDNFISFMNNIKEWENIEIIIDTAGGLSVVMDLTATYLKDFLKINDKITLVIYAGNISSAWFVFCYRFKKYVKTISNSFGVLHITWWDVTMWSGGVMRGQESIEKNIEMQDSEDRGYLFFTPKENEKYIEGGDIFLWHKRLAKIFDKGTFDRGRQQRDRYNNTPPTPAPPHPLMERDFPRDTIASIKF